MDIHFEKLNELLDSLNSLGSCLECNRIFHVGDFIICSGELSCPSCEGNNVLSTMTVLGIEDSEGILGQG